LPALLEQVAAPVGGLDFVADGVRQRHLGDFSRKALLTALLLPSGRK
jgi:hypothetical protein